MSREIFRNQLLNTFSAHPNRLALVYGQKTSQFAVSYSSLRSLSTKLSNYFQQTFGNERMYICFNLQSKLYLLPLFIALWENDLAAVCVKDPNNFKRVEEVLNVRYLITDIVEKKHKLKADFRIMGTQLYIYELHTEATKPFPVEWNMCYALCTSGSTGLPKLVQVPWSCIYPNVEELVHIFGITKDDVIAWRSPFTFDPFFIELLGSLISGACLLLDESVPDHSATACFSWDYQETSGIQSSVLQTTPSIYKSLYRDCEDLRILILGGEIFPKVFKPSAESRVFNIYGITEISCWSFIQEIKSGTENSIGKPLRGIVYKIEDGELWIGSSSRKCLVDFELPEDLPETVFRPTGDLVQESDELYVVDRTDNVVKILGNKVSLLNFYSALDTYKEYDDYCVIFDDISLSLTLFLLDKSVQGTHQVLTPILFSNLKPIERLDAVFKLGKFPLNDHGKIDRSALKIIARQEWLQNGESSQKAFERLWCKVLGLNCAPPEKTFTQCGGDSVSALKFLTRLDAMNVSVSSSLVTKLLGSFTFRECCSLIEGHSGEQPQVEEQDALLSTRWSFNMKKCIDATPSFVLVRGVWCVCVGSHSSQISLLEVESGRLLWTIHLGDRIESGIGVSSDHKYLYTGCYDRNIYCLAAESGDVIWKFQTGGMIKSTPRLSDDGRFLFCGSYDKQMYCLNPLDGTVIASTAVNGSILATPVLTSTFLLFGTLRGECCAVNSNSLHCAWSKVLSSPIFSSPCLIHNGSRVLFAEVEGRVHCFQVGSGQHIWTVQCEGNIFSGLISFTLTTNSYVTFGCHDHHIYLVDVTHDPSITWKCLLDSPIACAPSVAKNYLACVSSAGFLYVIDLLARNVMSRLKITGQTFSSPQWHENLIFFGSRNDNFMCVEFNKSLMKSYYLCLLKSQICLGNNNLSVSKRGGNAEELR